MEKLRVCTAWRYNAHCLACDGQENSFFAGLSPDAIATLCVNVDNTATPSGEIFYRAGDEARYLWVLRTGAVKLLASTQEGKTRIVRVLKPGDVAGIEGLLAGSHAHTAVTAGITHACRIPVRAVRQLCLEQAGFQWNLMQKWQATLRETEQWLLDMSNTSAPVRVRMARLLLRLRDGESSRIHNFCRKDLSQMLGITMETASRTVATFLRERLLIKRKAGSRFYDANLTRLEMAARGE